MTLTKKSLVLLLVLIFLALPSVAFAEETLLPSLNISIGEAEGPQEVASTLTLVLLLTILSLVPSILILATAFTRIVIVLSLLRNAMGLQQIPPNQVIIGLALFLTIFVMAPVFVEVNNTAIQPYINEEIGFQEATQNVLKPIREYMRNQTRKSDLDLFMQMHGGQCSHCRRRAGLRAYARVLDQRAENRFSNGLCSLYTLLSYRHGCS